MIELLQSKRKNLKYDCEMAFNCLSSCSPLVSGVTEEHLAKMGIKYDGVLLLKEGSEDLFAKTMSLEKDNLWSSQNFHRQFQVLSTLVSREAC
jgi:hypothetical protein